MRRLVWLSGAPAGDAEELCKLLAAPVPVIRLAELAGAAGAPERFRESMERRLRQLAAEPGDALVLGGLCRSEGNGFVPLVSAELARLLKPERIVLLEFFFTPAAQRELRGELEIVRRDKGQVAELRAIREQQELVRAYALALCAASGARLERVAVDRAKVKAGL
ncbi:MAG TPA: hypothetical protein VJB16_05480, partial [archaeon]|nr:hypothetical protein [archaeon]